MEGNKNSGSDKAWELLAALDPAAVCRAAAVSYDGASSTYAVRSLGRDVVVSLPLRTVAGSAPGSDAVLRRHESFLDLAVLWYLVRAKDLACTNRLVGLSGITGGGIFAKGSHVLPLDEIAIRYGKNGKGFLERGLELGGNVRNIGDASVQLFPFPRIPAVMMLWLADDEFPARADLLFDSTCSLQVPVDVLWSIAMMTVLAMA